MIHIGKKKHLIFGITLKKHLAEMLKIQVINMKYQKNLILYEGLHPQEELRKEYKKLCRIHHPDKGGKTTMFQRLQNLYERLCSSFC